VAAKPLQTCGLLMSSKSLSIIIPCFNEEATISEVLRRVIDSEVMGLSLEVVIIDDGSTDGSVKIIEAAAHSDTRVHIEKHASNCGKGAAIRTGFKAAKGDIILFQVADLEYDPA